MSEPYTLDADLYPDISNIVTEDDTSKHDSSDIDLAPDISHIITEDDTPVDNFASDKLQRLLVESIDNSWSAPGISQILAAANVALFYTVKKPPLVPDITVAER